MDKVSNFNLSITIAPSFKISKPKYMKSPQGQILEHGPKKTHARPFSFYLNLEVNWQGNVIIMLLSQYNGVDWEKKHLYLQEVIVL